VCLAYRLLGEGAIDMLVHFDWIGNMIFYDRRGTGLSSRNVSPPNLETATADATARS
jgi:hypothetical protein